MVDTKVIERNYLIFVLIRLLRKDEMMLKWRLAVHFLKIRSYLLALLQIYSMYDTDPFMVFIKSQAGILSFQRVGKILTTFPEFGVIRSEKPGGNIVYTFLITSK